MTEDRAQANALSAKLVRLPGETAPVPVLYEAKIERDYTDGEGVRRVAAYVAVGV